MSAQKKHPRIVPEKDVNEGTVEFTDGSRIVPDWQRSFLGTGETKIEMTYAEWVQKVVNEGMTGGFFRRARDTLVRQHLNL